MNTVFVVAVLLLAFVGQVTIGVIVGRWLGDYLHRRSRPK